ncbi:MAG: hypothetical protein ACE5IP_12210 [Terriglobia bacterium]
MRSRKHRRVWVGAAVLVAGATVVLSLEPAFAQQAKHHHDLRGVITKIEAAKNRFEIKTDAGKIVRCVVDEKSALKRGTEKISLKDVRPGERAHCHCASLRDGRHYSRSLLLAPAKKKDK